MVLADVSPIGIPRRRRFRRGPSRKKVAESDGTTASPEITKKG
jgi:hypothetical protein